MKPLTFFRKIRLSLFYYVLSLTIVSCKVAKDISLPKAQLPDKFRSSFSKDSVSSGRLPYDDFFNDPQLKQLIADALAHNNDLGIAIKNIDIAQLTLLQARLGNLPTLAIQATAVSNRPSDNSLNGLSLNQFLGARHVEDYTTAASLTWEADLWGKIREQKAAALADFLSSREARKLLQTRIVSDVAKAYYNLLMLDDQLSVARKNVSLNDSTLDIIRLQYQAGQVTQLAIQQASAQQLSAAKLIPVFEQEITVQENALSILCGKLPETVHRSVTSMPAISPEKLSAGVPADLLSQRPDVRQAELALTRANALVGYRKASMYPSLTITAQGGLNAFKASNWFNIPASLFGSVLGGVSEPLFDKKRLRTAFNIAKVNREQTVLQFRQSVLNAVGEVSDAMIRIEKLDTESRLVTERSAILQHAVRNSRMLFSNGMATYLEVITAQSNVLQSELELATVKKSRMDAQIDLYRSLGGGWW